MASSAARRSEEVKENEQLEALLIECIRMRPVLYNRDNADFRNNEKKEETWREISDIMDVPVYDCKLKWIRLREYFARFLRCNPKTRHFSEVKKPWVHLERMWWLKNHVRKRKVKLAERRLHKNLSSEAKESFNEIWESPDVSYLATTEVVLEESVTTSDINEDEEMLEIPENGNGTEIYYPDGSQEVTINKSYRKASYCADERDAKKRDHKYAKQESDGETVNHSNMLGKLIKKRKEDRCKDVVDPYGNRNFCSSLVPMLDQLSPEYNIDCKIAIMNIMKQFITK